MFDRVDDDEFRFTNASTQEGHLHQNDLLTYLKELPSPEDVSIPLNYKLLCLL